jgi:hypothetical protein
MELLLLRTAGFLARQQYIADGATYFRGEFPMSLSDDGGSRRDHNYLSGYTLLHIAAALRAGAMPDEARRHLEGITETARFLPGCYQTPAGLGNWYSGRGTGVPAPADYPWPHNVVLCLRDDYDDTAISCLLTRLGPFESRTPYTAALFAAAAYRPGVHKLARQTMRRIEVVVGADGAYRSWALEQSPTAEDWERHRGPYAGGLPTRWLPPENSIELTTAANVFSAVHLLDPAESESQAASRRFVNRLTAAAVERLIAGDASYLDFASSYYPRVPFAPLLFLVRDHLLTGGALLDDEVLDAVAEAVTTVDPHIGWRQHDFANSAFWLGCCAWMLKGGFVAKERVADRVAEIHRELEALPGEDGCWPDTVFFMGAHLGNYGGRPYIAAMMVETLSLLLDAGF